LRYIFHKFSPAIFYLLEVILYRISCTAIIIIAGIFYGMKNYLETNNLLALNLNLTSGIPIKAPFCKMAKELIEGFSKKY